MPESPAERDAARAAIADRARTPLLNLITQESLDQDYQHVAEKKRLAPPGEDASSGRPRWVAAAVVAAFGMLVAVAAVQTSNASDITSASRQELLGQIKARGDDAAAVQGELVRQRARNIRLQDARDAVAADERTTDNRRDRLAAQTGFGPVSGPGVEITVDDAPGGAAVHDEDLTLLVNGLWQAGAEAIAINGKRLTARSAIRNAGAAINVNGAPLSPPYVVSAIGDDRTLQADLLETTTGLRFANLADALGFRVVQNVGDLDLPGAPQRLLELLSARSGDDREPPARKKEPPS
ncbi:DUF881 domain-containing protein [Nocardioides sp. MAH-18]|uniref:DUF881 domain-containing protein n=1 Tax=Nocardioides agri TaxID=2682843 RepID=A0A6L6XYU0_9ACTN|nr:MULTISPECIES: DUF881 domain-containing protein [unclassified Nocardioides]MBA2952665.1 DUF881 domain-containing protein [Nocardioides sp. CGMCC 1.13656]MVQ51827.1 DUF881 domain-containing protein [Nocardioides sp. MAH-18]